MTRAGSKSKSEPYLFIDRFSEVLFMCFTCDKFRKKIQPFTMCEL